MNRRRFLRNLGLGGLVAWFAQMPAAVASTLESCHQALLDIRDIALGPGKPQDRLAAIVAIVDGELGSIAPTISGDFAGVIPMGETWKVSGDLNLTGDLIVEGLLGSTVDTFTVEGNGYQILVQSGGQLDWAGKLKKAWALWGDDVDWNAGDQLAVAPMAEGVRVAPLMQWSGGWGSRPADSPDVTLRDGRVMRPEVVNLSRSIVIRNVSRVMFHHMPGVQALRNVAVVDSGVAGSLDFYPIHLHLAGDSVRGSVFDRVAVINGKNHAFVPHGSHGVTFRDCVAFGVAGDAFWWNTPSAADYTPADDSHDLTFERCVTMGVHLGHGFRLAGGEGGRMVGCVDAGNSHWGDRGSVHWRHGTGVWEFHDFVSHNNSARGVTVWQNQSGSVHLVEEVIAFRNFEIDYDHGAYGNLYHYRNIYGDKFVLHAKSEEGDAYLTIEDSDLLELEVTKHALGRWKEAKVIGSQIGLVRYTEYEGFPSWMQYIDCGLTPDDFVFEQVQADTLAQIIEGGVETHRFEAGSWVS